MEPKSFQLLFNPSSAVIINFSIAVPVLVQEPNVLKFSSGTVPVPVVLCTNMYLANR